MKKRLTEITSVSLFQFFSYDYPTTRLTIFFGT